MNLNEETRVKEIAVSHTNARKVLEQAGVDYCGGGDKSLRYACTQSDVPVEEIMQRLRAVAAEAHTAHEADWVLAPLPEITQHIVERHHGYVREAIRKVQPLVAKVKSKHGERHPELAVLRSFFRRSPRK